MRKVIFDTQCSECKHIEENVYDETGKEHYGICPACNEGKMQKMFAAVSHSFATPPDTASKGRTTNGTRWEVGSKPKKYNPANGTYK